MKKKVTPTNPFSTGGGGVRFEWLVATSYLVSLLRAESAHGLPLPWSGAVLEVRLQQRNRGNPLDDVVVIMGQGTRQAKLAFQVKHDIRFTNNALFREVLADCWQHFKSAGFNSRRDYLGIAIGEKANIVKVRTHIQDVLEWARTSTTEQGFFFRVNKFVQKKRCLDAIQRAFRTAVGPIPNKRLWEFLKCLVIVPFDFDHPGSRDSRDCWNGLCNLIRHKNASQAASLFNALYQLVSRFSQAGGEIDYDILRKELGVAIPAPCFSTIRSIKACLVRQVTNQLQREKQSKKYIPDIFTEVASIKDTARYFCHPVLFYESILDAVSRINTSFLNRLLLSLKMPEFHVSLPRRFRRSTEMGAVAAQAGKLLSHFSKMATTLYDDYHHENEKDFEKRIPKERKYVFRESKYQLHAPCWTVRRTIESIQSDLRVIQSRVLLLTSRAGQGKTNFVCDFAENFLLPRHIPCVLLTGREIRSVQQEHLKSHIVRLLLGTDSNASLKELMESVGELCLEMNAPFVLIIDGINEHRQVSAFASELESVVAELLLYPFMRIVLTCRSEYYSERFANLQQANFSNEVHRVSELQQLMPERHKQQMVRAYLRFFNIRAGAISKRVKQLLEDDPLLLRFFCEAYGGKTSSSPTILPAMPDIYREEVFRKYLEKKMREVATRVDHSVGVGIPLDTAYKDVLRALVSIMVERRTFSDIPIANLDARHHVALSELIAEDVFVRKDLVEGKSVLDPNAEVINFTFDEFRDFLLADHLLTVVYPALKNKADFSSALLQLTDSKCPVSEGLSRYVFYASKRQTELGLRKIVAGMPWYRYVFLECIFSVQDQHVTSEDLKYIQDEFTRDAGAAETITFALMSRWYIQTPLKINITLLFRILDSLTDDQYDKLFRPLFENRLARYNFTQQPAYPIDKLVSDIRTVLGRTVRWTKDYDRLCEFLVYLLPIEGSEYGCPAYALFRDIAEQSPTECVRLLADHTNCTVSLVVAHIWKMLAGLASTGVCMPAMLADRAGSILKDSSVTVSIRNEAGRFVKACHEKLGLEIPADVISALPPHVSVWDFFRGGKP